MDNIDFGSDSDDQSDEDYCPLKENTEALSEEESGNESHDNDDDDTDTKGRSTKTSGKSKKPKANTSTSRKRKPEPADAGEIAELVEETGSKTEDVDEKAHADSLWASFLGDTDTKTETAPKPVVKKQIITETVEFAGEKIEIVKEVPVTSAPSTTRRESPKATQSLFDTTTSSSNPMNALPGRSNGSPAGLGIATVGARKFGGGASGGLNSILGQIGKKNKIGVLEKSALDWKSFKKVEGIDEQLQTHNKGKDGYLDRQDFLQRTDLRQFEIEKNLRTVQRSKR